MTKLVQDAIERLKELPEDRQATVARAIIDYASRDGDEVYRLSDEERAAVRAGLAQADRGEFVSDAAVHAFRNRHRA